MTIKLYYLRETDIDQLNQVRVFFKNYAAWLGVDLSYQNFDQEMASLPGAYTAPQGCLIYAEYNGQPAGCVGIRPMSEGVCELKRLYVSPDHRGLGIGHELAVAAIKSARKIGYRKIILDTLPNMRIAMKLYRELGFNEAPAYYQTPIEGTQFLALDLENWSDQHVANENLHHLFDFNVAWAKQMTQVDPEYFERLSHLQTPEYLWIGCSDSRVPANQIVGLLPGEVFVHRNVANLVIHTDLNCFSVIQFAIDVLKVKHIMVVGHYGCGGVGAVIKDERVGLADFWLQHVRDIYNKYRQSIDALPNDETRHDRLCEVNVLEQVANLCSSVIVQDAWARGQKLSVHGWIYGIKDGHLRDLGITVGKPEDLADKFTVALGKLHVEAP